MDTGMGNLNNQLEDKGKADVTVAADRASEALNVAIDLLEDIQKVISGGRPRAVKIRFGDKVIAEVPVALTAAAAVAAGLAAVVLTKLAIDVERDA